MGPQERREPPQGRAPGRESRCLLGSLITECNAEETGTGLWDSDQLPAPRVPHSNFTLTGLGGIKRKTNGNWCWGPLGVPGQ